MTNRFQVALNDVDVDYQELFYYWESMYNQKEYEYKVKQVKENIDTLQELIDNYTKFNEDKSCQYICDTKALLEEELSIVKERLSITERALDKACEWITDNDGWVNIFGNDDFRDRFPNGVKTKEDWKEYLLKESEKQ